MNNEEVSKEIEEFLKYNAPEINDLKQLSPELATAFNNVIVEIDKKYGKNSIGSEIVNILTQSPPQIIYSRFLAGDFLNDVNEINIPFTILYKNNTFSEEIIFDSTNRYLGKFNGFTDVLIVLDIYEINGIQYYATTPSENLDFYSNTQMVIDDDYQIYLFEVSKLDEFYNNYFKTNVRSVFAIGEYLIAEKFNDIDYTTINKKPLVEKFYVEQDSMGMFFPHLPIPQKIEPSFLLKEYKYIFVKDILNFKNSNYYILECHNIDDNLATSNKMAIKVEDFDVCYQDIFKSIKNNSVLKVTDTNTMETIGFIWYKKIVIFFDEDDVLKVKTESLTLSRDLLSAKSYENNPKEIRIFYDYTMSNDAISQGRIMLTNKKSREIIDEYESIVPPQRIVIGNSSQMSSNNLPSIERPTYMNNSVKNKDNSKSGQPTSKATAFNVTEIVMGTDGFLYDVAMKNGKKVWSKGENIFDTLPIDVFEGDTPSPTYILKQSVLKETEKSLSGYLSYFDPSSEDYLDLKQNIDSIQKNIMYNPNVDIYS